MPCLHIRFAFFVIWSRGWISEDRDRKLKKRFTILSLICTILLFCIKFQGNCWCRIKTFHHFVRTAEYADMIVHSFVRPFIHWFIHIFCLYFLFQKFKSILMRHLNVKISFPFSKSLIFLSIRTIRSQFPCKIHKRNEQTQISFLSLSKIIKNNFNTFSFSEREIELSVRNKQNENLRARGKLSTWQNIKYYKIQLSVSLTNVCIKWDLVQ